MVPTSLLLACLALPALALPTDRHEASSLLSEDPALNTVNVDEKVEKVEEEVQVSPAAPLGSQFAVDFTHPDRRALVTGHRIPLGLFPLTTQQRILGLPQTEDSARYVEASSFRRPARLAVLPLPSRQLLPPSPPPALPPRDPRPLDTSLSAFGHPSSVLAQEGEGDKAYSASLRTFLPPSFF